jgi:chemotaxis protein CheC
MNLNALELDALTEIFNQGVGVAANALSELAGEEVMLSVPSVTEVPKRDITQRMDKLGIGRICAVRQSFTGAVTTDALVMFPVEQSLQLVQLMVGDAVPLEQLSEMEQESLAEIGNIVLNSVVSSIADLLKIEFEGSLPQVELGHTNDVLCPTGDFDSLVLSVQINFDIASRSIQGYLVFLLDVASGEQLEKRLNTFIAEAG